MDAGFEIDEPGVLHQTQIGIVDGDCQILLIPDRAGQRCREAHLNRKKKTDENNGYNQPFHRKILLSSTFSLSPACRQAGGEG
jgi:hypothetical protein